MRRVLGIVSGVLGAVTIGFHAGCRRSVGIDRPALCCALRPRCRYLSGGIAASREYLAQFKNSLPGESAIFYRSYIAPAGCPSASTSVDRTTDLSCVSLSK
ncbi:hypothetical protein DFP72DRAFT_274907 [Ephemerocybe angulata]|uniref:Uncharacterized protein n=1 Tax=Ephemerocybe angulata TaxID=980116 RepID=A0A8H6I0Y1_9AGAR|nr:hypothetical protein DFP72DRAFT_274907 [Tulosesus angulatus]